DLLRTRIVIRGGPPGRGRGGCRRARAIAPRVDRRRHTQDVPAAAPAVPDPQGARSASPARPCLRRAPRRRRRVGGDRRGRVLRHRRPQRLGQEHAAQVPRGYLSGRHRAGRHQRPPVAVHRARRGLQPRAQRPRERRHQRDHARPHPPPGAGALRRDHRLRRARGVRRPSAEELLVRHERAARLRGGHPGRRRDPARRRGARGRRRRLPAEVLRRVPPHEGRAPHDRLRHPRHERGRALLRPGDADRARRGADDRRAAPHRPRLQRAQLRRPDPYAGRRRGPLGRPGRRGDPRLLVRGPAWRSHPGAGPGRPIHRLHRDPLPRRRREPDLRPVAAQRGPPHRLRHLQPAPPGGDRELRRRRTSRLPGDGRQLARAGDLPGDSLGGPGRRRSRRPRRARGPHRLRGPRDARVGRRRRPAALPRAGAGL
ncbi:MAG: Teichoic acid export ATP-binding protein TagH, partial [uncultured Solirubrobacteraceae bacterium]